MYFVIPQRTFDYSMDLKGVWTSIGQENNIEVYKQKNIQLAYV